MAIEIEIGELKERFELRDRLYLIGRSRDCHIRFSDDPIQYPQEKIRLPKDPYLSKVHATLIRVDPPLELSYYILRDGEVGSYKAGETREPKPSANGVFVELGGRWQRLGLKRHSLVHGDRVRLSPTVFLTYTTRQEPPTDGETLDTEIEIS